MTKLFLNVDPSVWLLFGGFAVLLVGMMVYGSIRRRRAHEDYSSMLDTLRPGMRVKTVGGVIGVIVEIREEAPGFKTVVLETGSDNNKSFVLYDLQAIYGIVDVEKMIAAAEALNAKPSDIDDHKPADKRVDGSENVFEPKKSNKKSNSGN